ncbi:MAG: helix-turn-helix domain-containing protein [Acidobacteria bacterium]|nr:helix-turn-helix domain-containing protein [Acidobacteriota bacterium]
MTLDGMSPAPTSSEISNNGRRPVASMQWTHEPLLDTDEAAAFIRIHPKTLQRFAREGQIQGIHIGKLWRFRQSALEQWIERQTGTKVSA